MSVDGGRGGQPDGLADFAHGGRVVLDLYALANVVEYLLLARGELFFIHTILLDSLRRF